MAQVFLLTLAAVLVSLAIFVWRARAHSPINRWFAGFTVFVACWAIGVAGLQSGAHLNGWGRFTFASATMIPLAFLQFTYAYPTRSSWPGRGVRLAFIGAGIGIAVVSLTTPLVVYDNIVTASGLQRQSGPVYPLFFLYFLATWALAFVLFFTKWSQARGLARAQLQHLGAAILISGAGGSAANLFLPLLTGHSRHSWIGPSFGLLLVLMVGHAIIRHRLMDLRLFVNRGLAQAIIVVIISAAVILIGKSLDHGWDRPFQLHPSALVFALVAFFMLTKPAQKLIGRLVDPYLYRGRIEHSSALREATHRLTHLMQPIELADELHRILSEAFVPESFTMAARPLEGGTLEPLFADPAGNAELVTVATSLIRTPRPSVFIVRPEVEGGRKASAHETLRTADVDIVIALARRGSLLGIVLLGSRRSGDAYFTRDVAFIESLAELASIALENALLYRQSLQMLEYSARLLESLDSAVVAVDVAGKIKSFNPAAKSLLGLADTATDSDLSALPSEIAWALAFALSGMWHHREIEISIDHESKGVVPLVLSTALLHDDRVRISGAIVVATDLSTVKALERNQRRIEHFAMMARFYAGIAHEIRSPLGAISNFISMLPDRFDDPEYRDTVARLLPLEVARIVRLADRLRLMAPSEDGKLQVVSLRPLLADIVAIHSPTAEDSRVRILLDCPEDLPDIHGDPSQLVQLFVNLMRNGIEAMTDGGVLTIRCSSRGLETLVVDVLDQGTGIDPSIRGKIFEPFFTTKPLGTGLGLSICREIADFHRARLLLMPRTSQLGTLARLEFAAIPADRSPRYANVALITPSQRPLG